MSYVRETEEYKGYTIKIESDEDPMNPRTDWDNACTMVCWHRRYHLGDMKIVSKNNYRPVSEGYSEPIDLLYELAGLDRTDCQDEEGNDWSYEQLYTSIEERGTIISPLYLYDHSGITISMGGFSCPWDSGQVGFIYIEKDKIQEEWDGDYESAKKCMEGEVQTYDDYLTNNVWRYEILDSDAEWIDSCGGYYGDEGVKDAMTDAKHSIDCKCKTAQEEYEKQPKHKHSEMATL